MPGWAPCRAIGYSHPYRWCIVAWRRVRLHPCHCGRLWAKVPSSLCRHSEPRRRPLPAGTRVLVQRPVAEPEHNGKRARAVVRRAHRPVCGCAGRREGAVAQGRARGEDGVRGGGGEQRVRAALPPPRVLSVLSVLSVAVLCAQWRCAATARPGWAERDCLGSAASARGHRCSLHHAAARAQPEWPAAGRCRATRLRSARARRRRRRRTPERPTWSSVQYDTAQCADQGAASTPPAARVCGRSRV